MEAITPMLKQYQTLKSRYKDSVLFFRLGDFYEMFYDDALLSSPILNVVLTSRDAGKSGRIPMCGIPYHARENYIAKLIKAGHKVAICEQVEDPAKAKGLVKRDVIRIITSGTFIDDSSYEARTIIGLCFREHGTGLALLDITDGSIQTNQYDDQGKVIALLSKIPFLECVFPLSDEEKARALFKHPHLSVKTAALTPHDDWCFNPDISRKTLQEHFKTHSLRGFGIEEKPLAVASAGALLEYVKQMNRMPMRHIARLSLYTDEEYVFISQAAVYGLDLDGLFRCIDHTLMPLGKRRLKKWILHPLKDKEAILIRQEATNILKDDPHTYDALHTLLRHLPDMEKSVSRISAADGSARDLLALRTVLVSVPRINSCLEALKEKNSLFALHDPAALRILLEKAINPEVPLSNPHGKIIRTGYHAELDEIRALQTNAKELLKNLQAREIKRTGINSLKIGFNQVFGYYIEVTRAHLKSVPSDFIRKQTLVNSERFITPELKDYEEKMLTCEQKLYAIEQDLINEINQRVLDNAQDLHILAEQLSTIDALRSLATLALCPGYCRPEMTAGTTIDIRDGRHPMVEKSLSEPFIPNDTLLDTQDNHLIILTGPNMSGKSTYIRQTAVLVIMAQMGSFIPAARASIGLVDKIFTRIGAHDEITKGQSTFMVEMSETADILNNVTPRSLVILDEIGRGTSTYDGLSLAWAIAEHLNSRKIRALFATHFHELTALAQDHPGVKNYNVAVKEWNTEVVFLHKIVPGGTDDSYGIYVAKLAGIPQEVIRRSRQILTRLELSGKLHDKIRARSDETQLSFLAAHDTFSEDIKKELLELDLNSLTPLELMNKVQNWKEKLK